MEGFWGRVSHQLFFFLLFLNFSLVNSYTKELKSVQKNFFLFEIRFLNLNHDDEVMG